MSSDGAGVSEAEIPETRNERIRLRNFEDILPIEFAAILKRRQRLSEKEDKPWRGSIVPLAPKKTSGGLVSMNIEGNRRVPTVFAISFALCGVGNHPAALSNSAGPPTPIGRTTTARDPSRFHARSMALPYRAAASARPRFAWGRFRRLMNIVASRTLTTFLPCRAEAISVLASAQP